MKTAPPSQCHHLELLQTVAKAVAKFGGGSGGLVEKKSLDILRDERQWGGDEVGDAHQVGHDVHASSRAVAGDTGRFVQSPEGLHLHKQPKHETGDLKDSAVAGQTGYLKWRLP